MDDEQEINPYLPARETEVDRGEWESDREKTPIPRASLGWTAIRWIFVCVLSALPSFVLGLTVAQNEIAAMVLGILIFTIGYTVLDYGTASSRFRQNRKVSRTLRIAYGTRVAISILFPLAFYLDLFCGVITLTLTQRFTGVDAIYDDIDGFFGTLLTTLVQGLVLNLVLGVYALIVHAIQLFVIAVRR